MSGLFYFYTMRNTPFYITDVFGLEKYTGNQLATFIDKGILSDNEMQQIAHEINFSETTFVTQKPNSDGSFNVRIFTPKAEVDFAGHPCLGTAFIIQNYLQNKTADKVVLNLNVGKINIRQYNNAWWMEQIQPQFGKSFDKKTMAKVLGLKEADIDENFPIEEVSTGLPFTILPLKTQKALREACIQLVHYEAFAKTTNTKGVLVFCPEGHTSEQDLSVRVFVPQLGIAEDPATGSANGCLAAYLLKNKYFETEIIDISVGQGYEMRRPSQLFLKAEKLIDKYKIKVGGNVFPISEGTWL